MMSEVVQESRSKVLRKKFKKITMHDLMHSLLFSSDPLIFSISIRPSLYSRNQIIVDYDVQNLLLEQNIQKDTVCPYNSDSDYIHT